MELLFPWILMAHWLGDFVFQTSYMSKTKKLPSSEGRKACLLHSAIYGMSYLVLLLPYLFSTYLPNPGLYSVVKPIGVLAIALFASITHYPIDRSNFCFRRFGHLKEWYPVLYVIVDNGIHVFGIFLVISFFSKL
jgi:hypothetical protein